MKLGILGLGMLMGLAFLASCGDDDDVKKVKLTIKGSEEAPASSLSLVKSAFQTAMAGELKLTVYKMGFSTSGDCSSPVVVSFGEGDEGKEVDFAAEDSGIGVVEIPAGDYQCVSIEMSDIYKFKSTTAAGASCDAGTTEYPRDLCVLHADYAAEGSAWKSYKLLDGSDADICGATADVAAGSRVVVHLSVDGVADRSDSAAVDMFMFPPGSADPVTFSVGGSDRKLFGGINLDEFFDASSDSTAILYWNTTGKVSTESSSCTISGLEFGFVKE